MKCPHCDYKHGCCWEDGKFSQFVGEHGEFWELPVNMERDNIELVWQKSYRQ